MNVLISGASGLVGTALEAELQSQGKNVYHLVRRDIFPGRREVSWDPEGGQLDPNHLAGADAVVHLAGEPIASGRWNAKRKARIRDSRVKGTRLLAERICEMKRKPTVVVCASAIGYYGDRGDELLTQGSSLGSGFLADLCKEWEAAAQPLRDAGIRTVHSRIGIVISKKGGALAKMLPPFELGAGGVIGSGKQYMSWIDVADAARAIAHIIATDSLDGPVNLVGPKPVTNREFTKTLGAVLGRPTVAPLPGFVAKLMLGEMAKELLLASQRVEPEKLLGSGFKFTYGDIEKSLRHALGR